MPKDTGFVTRTMGRSLLFDQRYFNHKNFEEMIPVGLEGIQHYYVKLNSQSGNTVQVKVRNLKHFFAYSTQEYLLFGFFFGLSAIVILYNLLMLIALQERQYLFYILYVFGFAMYFLSNTGVGFQYLWSSINEIDLYMPRIFLFVSVFFALLFTRSFFDTKVQFKFLDKLLLIVIGIRCLIFVLNMAEVVPVYRAIEFGSLGLAIFIGVYGWRSGYRAARFFVISYSILAVGLIIKSLVNLGAIPPSPGVFYAVPITFSVANVLLTFALADKISIIRLDKERANKKIIQSLEKNQRLKDKVNRELEAKVATRTLELHEKNKELEDANLKLQLQSEEISQMNVELDMDNRTLKKNIKKTLTDRVMKPNVNFEEFKQVFPDSNTCYKFLEEKKEENGFVCAKCSNKKYGPGPKPYSRRCSKCGYVASVTANTIFHGIRFPIEKAFYIFYLTISNRSDYTIDQISELISLRRNTSWSFKKKVEAVIDAQEEPITTDLSDNWHLIFDVQSTNPKSED